MAWGLHILLFVVWCCGGVLLYILYLCFAECDNVISGDVSGAHASMKRLFHLDKRMFAPDSLIIISNIGEYVTISLLAHG